MQAAAPANSMHAKLAQANIEEANAVLAGKKPGELPIAQRIQQ